MPWGTANSELIQRLARPGGGVLAILMEFVLKRVPEPERGALARPQCQLMTETHPPEPGGLEFFLFRKQNSPAKKALGVEVWSWWRRGREPVSTNCVSRGSEQPK